MLGEFFKFALGRRPKHFTPQQVRALIAQSRWDEAQAAAAALHPALHRRDLERQSLEAEIAFHRGDDATAERGFKAVLADDAANAEANYGLSLLLFEQGQVEAALRHAQFAVGGNAQEGRYLAQLALCHVQLGNYPQADGLLRKALRMLPEDKTCWNNMGIVQAAKGDHASARLCFSKALSFDPAFVNARDNLALLEQEAPTRAPQVPAEPASIVLGVASPEPDAGTPDVDADPSSPWAQAWAEVVALQVAQEFDTAMHQAERLAAQWPDDPVLTCQVAKLYVAQGDVQGGIDTLDAFLQRHPDDTAVLLAMGRARATVSEHKAAEACVRRAIELGDDSAQALSLLSEILHAREDYQAAADTAEEAIGKAERRSVALLAQLAAAQVMACRYEQAAASYEELFALKGRANNPAIGGYALCIAYLGRFDEALEILADLLRWNPNDPGLHMQRGQILLLHEDYGRGWDDYLYRGLSQTKHFRVLPFPAWQGEPLQGKTVVVLAEQGLGDQVMFASCIPDLLAQEPKAVYVEAINRVAPTLARSFPQCKVIATAQNRQLDWVKDVGAADFYVPLGDLPARFRRSRDMFPGVPFLQADPERVRYWRARMEADGPGPYIGLSWRGGTQLTRKVLRSFTPEVFGPLQSQLQATWVNLQYGDVAQEVRTAHEQGVSLLYWPEAIADLDEFAALVTALDAVVTVCNTTVHYAGAVGAKVWVLAPHIPEWRYGVSYERMPWYRDVTVLRQHSEGDWSRPLARVERALIEHFGVQPDTADQTRPADTNASDATPARAG